MPSFVILKVIQIIFVVVGWKLKSNARDGEHFWEIFVVWFDKMNFGDLRMKMYTHMNAQTMN